MHRGNHEEYCAGKIAEIYSSLGGEVIYFGKPYREVYELILENQIRTIMTFPNGDKKQWL